jgi:hypothetical protein
MPWQQHVADVALEIDPETGLLAYDEVVVLVGRQQGKTTLLLPKLVHRHLGFGTAQRTAYTAQTGDKAREKWRDLHVAAIKASPLKRLVADIRLTLNKERLLWNNGSSHVPVTPSVSTGGTGDTLDEAHVDEAWAFVDNRVEQAVVPAMLTRPQHQLVVASTGKKQPEGEPLNPLFGAYLRGKLRTGRAHVAAGERRGMALFDWTAPLDVDPTDPATWWACLPAMGHTVTEAGIRSLLTTLGLPTFCAEMLGWWPGEQELRWQVIPKADWTLLADRGQKVGWPLALAVDVSPNRDMTTIAAASAALRPGERPCVEVIDHRRGTEWVVERLTELVARWRPCAVAIAKSGSANSLAKPLTNVGIEPLLMSVQECAEAYGLFFDAVDCRELRHAGQQELDDAVSYALKRKVGGAAVWDWASPGDITAVVAGTNALWAATVKGPSQLAAEYDVLDTLGPAPTPAELGASHFE